jgi:hypothetical protein
MSTFKKAQVIMLPTSDTNPVTVPFLKLPSGKRLSKHLAGGEFRKLINYKAIPQHLYIVTDEPIKEGDYWYYLDSDTINHCSIGNFQQVKMINTAHDK